MDEEDRLKILESLKDLLEWEELSLFNLNAMLVANKVELDLEKKYKEEYGKNMSKENIGNFLDKYQKSIDSEKALMVIYYLLKENEKKMQVNTKYKEAVARYTSLKLSKIPKEKLVLFYKDEENDMENSEGTKVAIMSSNVLTGKPSRLSDKTNGKLLEKEYKIEHLAKFVQPMDLQMCSTIDDEILLKSLTNLLIDCIEHIEGDTYYDKMKNDKFDLYTKTQLSFINEFSGFLKLDKFLLTQAYRIKQYLEEGETKDLELNKEILEKIYDKIKDVGKNYATDVYDYKTGEVEARYSRRELKEDLQKFINGKYVCKKYIDFIVTKLDFYANVKDEGLKSIMRTIESSEEIDLQDIEEELAVFPREKILEIAQIKDEYLLQINDMCDLSKEEIVIVIENMRVEDKEIMPETFDKLYRKGKIENLFDLFEQGIIDVETIKYIRDNEKEDEKNLQREVDEKELVKLYNIAKSEDATVEQKQKFNQYMLLYKTIKNRGNVTESELKNNAEKMIEELGENITGEILEDFYKLELFSFGTVLEWADDETVKNILKSGYMKPKGVKEALVNGKLKEQILIDILKDKDIIYDTKMNILFSLFSDLTEKDLEAFEKYSQYISIGEDTKVTGGGKRNRNSTKPTKPSKKYAASAYAKIAFLKSLDDEVSIEHGKNGFEVVKLPNVGEGTIIIEKILNKDGSPVYGTATYVLDEEKYENYSMLPIDSVLLSELRKNDIAKRKPHTKHGWTDGLLKLAGIGKEETNTRYSPEQLKKIRKAEKLVKESREEIF